MNLNIIMDIIVKLKDQRVSDMVILNIVEHIKPTKISTLNNLCQK